ncbi:hypothetical protein I3843_04G127200 [Carya illinoinensis]|uniref:Myb/SANT-like domain-containing protein n=1 Tax=Carya illinoinensis TaxID=32201 RepID=A0A922JRQ9_CARIL|nr:hypothetical protein I3842_04G136000 [Carya illinoinensis]KAG7983851.1 hypothetical protein I3843_04G127200 [Carya illinoinensis]
MDDPENTHIDRELWSDEMEEKLIDLLYADALIGAIRVGRITSRDHAIYAQRLTAMGRSKYDASQIKGKIHRLKGKQRLFSDLISQTGIGWDPQTGTVIASDEHWSHAIRNFRHAGCPKYEELCTIFGASIATGAHAHASTQPPPTAEEEVQRDEDMRGRTNVRRRMNVGNQDGVVMDSPEMDGLFGYGQSSVSSGQNPRRRRKGATPGLQQEMSNCLSELARTSIARRKRYEEGDEASGSKRSRSTHSSKSDAHFDQHTQCVKLLQELEPPLPPENFLRAYNSLMVSKYQNGFLALEPINRRLWAMSL